MKKLLLILLLIILSISITCCVSGVDGKILPEKVEIIQQDTTKIIKDSIVTLNKQEKYEHLLKENKERHKNINENLQKLQKQHELLDSLLKKKKND